MNINVEWLEYQKEYARNQKPRISRVNICTARANWNACNYRDSGEAFVGINGVECYVQDKRHKCVYCIDKERIVTFNACV